MGMGSISKALTLVVVALAIAGCGTRSPSLPTGEIADKSGTGSRSFPTGEFVDKNDYIVSFMADGRVTGLGPSSIDEGLYSVDGDIITFTGTETCPGDAVYKWSYRDDKLLFEDTVEDDCCDRRKALKAGLTANP